MTPESGFNFFTDMLPVDLVLHSLKLLLAPYQRQPAASPFRQRVPVQRPAPTPDCPQNPFALPLC